MKRAGLLTALLAGRATAGEGETPRRRPVRRRDVAAMYRRPPSFTELLPWVDYLPEHRAFLLEDGRSVGAVLEVDPVPCEARPTAYLDNIHASLVSALGAIMEHHPSPWVVQAYVQDDHDLTPFVRRLEDYVGDGARGSAHTASWLALMRAHIERLTRAEGVFDDTVVTGERWGARLRRTRLVVYRRFHRETQDLAAALEALELQVARLRGALAAAGVRTHLVDGEHVYNWLVQWFNPAPSLCGGDPRGLTAAAPYPGDDDPPFGRDFAELVTRSMPESDPAAGVWRFDGLPHAPVSMQGLTRHPDTGVFTAERPSGDYIVSLFDRLPPGTVMAMTLIATPQDVLRGHVAKVKGASVGDAAEAVLARENATAVELEMARGERLIPTYLSFYVRGADEAELRGRITLVDSQLQHAGVKIIPREADLLALDSWVRNLPMNYDPVHDRAGRRSRLVFGADVARMLPVYGRSRGTGHPGLVFFNRGGEPLTVDPLNQRDRAKNGHLLLFGPTGAGKSATLVSLVLHVLAIHRPRLYIIEAGNSFGLTCDYLRGQGLTVHQAKMSPGADVSLPPFAGDLGALLDDPGADPERDEDADDSDDEGRDLLGEMELAARIMITGGEPREDARMSRADRTVIRRAILDAAQRVRDAGREQMLTQDVADELLILGGDDSDLGERRCERAADMGQAMGMFCSGLPGHFFNRAGARWPDVDVTHLEMGILAREGYQDQLTVAYTALINHVNGVLEAEQRDARPTIVVTDEGHIITANALLAPYVTKATKMWRKLGGWLWLATQNLEDFPDAARRLLAMIEWWLCLVMPKDEVEQIARFRNLTDEQRELLMSARKEPGKYTEGVLLTDTIAALVRNVPPAIALALAQTEKEEKAQRAALMREHGCSELDAALMIAEAIDRQRAGEGAS